MIRSFMLKIKNKNNKFYAFLNKSGKNLVNFSIPCIKPFHKLIWWIRFVLIAWWRWFLKSFYYTPLFKSMCYKTGKNLNLIGGMPYVNENLKIVIGDNVTIYGDAGFQGYKVFKNPILEIGNNTFIGPAVRIGIGKEVKIGNHCLIAARVFIADHDGHHSDWKKRRENVPVEKGDIKPIIIEDDVWVGEGAFICKGVKIGQGAIIGARAVVTKDILPFTVVGGNPAKFIKNIEKENYVE